MSINEVKLYLIKMKLRFWYMVMMIEAKESRMLCRFSRIIGHMTH